MPRRLPSLEDPDLICRVPSSAEGNISESSFLQLKEKPSKKPAALSAVSNNTQEIKTSSYDAHDHLTLLNSCSGSADPYALLRELHILPPTRKDGFNTGIDIRDYDVYNSSTIQEMINVVEGKPDTSSKGTEKHNIKEPTVIANSGNINNWGLCNGMTYGNSTGHNSVEDLRMKDKTNENKSKDDLAYHSPLCLMLIFGAQYLPVLVVASLYLIQTNEYHTSNKSDNHDHPSISDLKDDHE